MHGILACTGFEARPRDTLNVLERLMVNGTGLSDMKLHSTFLHRTSLLLHTIEELHRDCSDSCLLPAQMPVWTTPDLWRVHRLLRLDGNH